MNDTQLATLTTLPKQISLQHFR